MNTKQKRSSGFTLIEMMIAVALFAIVFLIAGATLLSLVYANRKAQALQSVMNNLNISLDEMVRSIREGSNFRCGGVEQPAGYDNDCVSGGYVLYFTPFGLPTDDAPADDWGYALCVENSSGQWLAANSEPQAGQEYSLCQEQKGSAWVPIISSEVQITYMQFYVTGTTPALDFGTSQPKVLFAIKGTAGAQESTQTTFNIQATAVQRVLNL